MQNRYVPIAVTVALLLAVALYGYATPVSRPDVPPRVVLDNSGGRVFFDHGAHAEDYGYECTECHHDGVEGRRPLPCGTCHARNFDEAFARTHADSFPNREYCARCHDVEPAPGLSKDDLPDKDLLPLRSDAFHGQCLGCHESVDAGPYGEDSCTTCHAK